MRTFVFWPLFLLVCKISLAQESVKKIDFIICVDDEIVTSLVKPLIIVKQGADVSKKMEIDYYPGNLSLSSEDYNMVFSRGEINLFLQFDYYQYSSKEQQKVYNYEVEIGKNWFEKKFVILRIYNLDKKKYRKILNPLSKDKNYTFDLETSDGQMIRIRKS